MYCAPDLKMDLRFKEHQGEDCDRLPVLCVTYYPVSLDFTLNLFQGFRREELL